jgi:hypothetical protein
MILLEKHTISRYGFRKYFSYITTCTRPYSIKKKFKGAVYIGLELFNSPVNSERQA